MGWMASTSVGFPCCCFTRIDFLNLFLISELRILSFRDNPFNHTIVISVLPILFTSSIMPETFHKWIVIVRGHEPVTFRLVFINVGIVNVSLPYVNPGPMQALLTLTSTDYGLFLFFMIPASCPVIIHLKILPVELSVTKPTPLTCLLVGRDWHRCRTKNNWKRAHELPSGANGHPKRRLCLLKNTHLAWTVCGNSGSWGGRGTLDVRQIS